MDIYGKVRYSYGGRSFCPFRYPGQYEDGETGLYYNRFRYYDPEDGVYVSQDPIGLGGGFRFYNYVFDSCIAIDPFGLAVFYHATSDAGAEAIRTKGIDVSYGRSNLDFNPTGKSGFYVTTEKAQANEWATKLSKNGKVRTEILKFDVPDDKLAQLKSKTFSTPNDEWKDTVVKGRKGTLIHDFDIVTGPMYKNPVKTPVKAKGQQTALFTDRAAKLFDQGLEKRGGCKK